MRHILLFFLLSVFIVTSVTAEETALFPPSKVKDTAAARETIEEPSESLNLNKELSSPKHVNDVRIRVFKRKDGTILENYISHGHVYMVHVKPAGNLPSYYLYDRIGNGTFERLPGGYKHISPPMWVIKRF